MSHGAFSAVFERVILLLIIRLLSDEAVGSVAEREAAEDEGKKREERTEKEGEGEAGR